MGVVGSDVVRAEVDGPVARWRDPAADVLRDDEERPMPVVEASGAGQTGDPATDDDGLNVPGHDASWHRRPGGLSNGSHLLAPPRHPGQPTWDTSRGTCYTAPTHQRDPTVPWFARKAAQPWQRATESKNRIKEPTDQSGQGCRRPPTGNRLGPRSSPYIRPNPARLAHPRSPPRPLSPRRSRNPRQLQSQRCAQG